MKVVHPLKSKLQSFPDQIKMKSHSPTIRPDIFTVWLRTVITKPTRFTASLSHPLSIPANLF